MVAVGGGSAPSASVINYFSGINNFATIDGTSIVSTLTTNRSLSRRGNRIEFGSRTYTFPETSSSDNGIISDETADEHVAIITIDDSYNYARISAFSVIDLNNSTNLALFNNDNAITADELPRLEFEEISIFNTSESMTSITDLPTSSRVDYSGDVEAIFLDTLNSPVTLNDVFQGTFSMSTDFSNPSGAVTAEVMDSTNTVVGNLTGTRGSGNDSNTFIGDYTNVSNFDPIDVHVNGAFYGPDASEVAGVGSGSYLTNGRATVSFIGRRD